MTIVRSVVLCALLASFVACGWFERWSESAETSRQYDVRGVVQRVAPDKQTVVVEHEEVPGFMPAMTMPFRLRDTAEVDGIEPRDIVTFKLHTTDNGHYIDSLTRVGRSEAPLAETEPAAALAPELAVGDAMPDYAFLSETGQTVRLSEFRGKVVAFTFIFTRCPIADYCPRMSKSFAEARAKLEANENMRDNWRLLSISFDPEFDSAQVLREYANIYREGEDPRWVFVAASNDTLADLGPRVDLMLERSEAGNIGHNLRTVVIDPQGKVARQFDGNEWTGVELAEAMVAAAGDK